MKIKFSFILIFYISLFSCSKSDSGNSDAELTITRCFTVKESGTQTAIANANVFLYSAEITCGGGGGCGPVAITSYKSTDINGQVCFNITPKQNENIAQIVCFSAQYKGFVLNNPSLNFKEILLEPL